MASHEIHVADAAATDPKHPEIDPEENSPIEQVRLTVPNTDDPTLPVWTFRMWVLGILSCVVLSFVNTFFYYRTEPLIITMISAQVATLPLGRLMEKYLPTTKFRILGLGKREFSLNPGPFNMKEHALISIFANCGSAMGGGTAYAVDIVNIVVAFYRRKISFLASWILVLTTQTIGYSWAGILRKYVVEPAEMWWPSCMVQVSLFRALHEKDRRRMSRGKFFVIVLICSFCWYTFPGYLIPIVSNISVLCWAFRKSTTMQLIGSGMDGLGILSFTLDWAVVASYLGSPLITPFFAIVNIFVGYVILIYGMIPLAYWGFDLYNAKTFPMFSSTLFDSKGQKYDVTSIVNDKFEIDIPKYEKQGLVNMGIMFSLSYGINFAAVVATLFHVALFNGKKIYKQFRKSSEGKEDIHTKLMRKYPEIPRWWTLATLVLSFALSLVLCIFMKDQVQLPWWGLLFSTGLSIIFTLPISIITATTNQTPGLNVITEYLFGLVYPGRPIANVCFKTFGYISMTQAVSFLNDFKLGHYMKIPPRSMFLVQLIGTVISGTINVAVAFWLLTSVDNICQPELLPTNSPWTCPNSRVFFDASVIWGLIGPKRIFGPLGNYNALNWGFLVGAVGPIILYLIYRAFPSKKWIKLVNLPVILGASGMMPPAGTLNFNSWLFIGAFFNFYVFRYRKKWWERYNYVLSAGLDAGLAFMGVLLFFTIGSESIGIDWWGISEHCELATCPTAKGVAVDGCPIH